MVDKKLVATTVSSREIGMQRRINQVTTSSNVEKENKNDETKEETSRIHISFKRKDSKKLFFTRVKEEHTKEEKKCSSRHWRHSATERRKSGSSKKRRPQHLESRRRRQRQQQQSLASGSKRRAAEKKTAPIVLQKNTRSLGSSERIQEMICELQRVEWDVIPISETWRQSKEIWETQEGHIMVESGQLINKHGVAMLNKRWKNQVKWVQCESERVVAMSISVNKQPIVLMSVYMPHSGYADHNFEKVYKTITKMIEREKSMKIIGGDFNAELGPGEGLELSAVGHYTLSKGNCRGEWMTQWLLQNKLVALNTMYKKIPQKQVTYCTSKDVGKQLDYILTDRKHYKWSRDAEASDTIHMGSDHRCVMARFEIP